MNPYDPPMAGRFLSPTLVGRAQELEALARALERAAAGEPVHQLIGGEAGVGKSRLVREASLMAGARGTRVLIGGCADIGDGGVPYGPIVEALRSLVRDLPEADLEPIVGHGRADLARLLPSLGAAADSAVQTEFLQPRLLDAVLGVFQRLSEASPVLFIVEDLHWADPASREAIAFLVRQLRTDRVLVVMTFRTDELQRRHPLLPWLAEVGRSGRVDRLDLARLDLIETGELLAAIQGEPPASDLVDQIHRRSDGNPFFVEELLGAGASASGGPLPPTLRDVLLARIVALPEDAQAIVRVAAVAGRRVDHDLLARVALMPESQLVNALRTAVGRQVLVTGSAGDEKAGDYGFRHALLQEAAYDDLLPGERQRLHRAFAEALAERSAGTGAIAAGHWAELAYHWAAARDDRRAFEASIRAGDAAERAFAFADSRRHDERALEIWSTIEDAETLAGLDRLSLIDRAADAAWLSGDGRRAATLRREAVAELRAGKDRVRLGTALERLGRALWFNGEVAAAIDAHEEALAVLPADRPTPELARALGGYAQILMLTDRWPEARDRAGKAVAMARNVGARQAEGHALCSLGLVLAALAQPAESEAALHGAIAIALEIEDADDVGRGYTNLVAARRYNGDLEGSLVAAREGIEAADRFGLTHTYGSFIRENGIVAAFELGRWAEADDLARDSIEIPHAGRQPFRYGLVRWLPLLIARGDERSGPRLRDLAELVEGFVVEGQFHGPFRIHAAEAALWAGDPTTALASIRKGIADLADPRGLWYEIRLFRVGMRAAAEMAETARARRDRAAERAAIEAGDGLWSTLEPILAGARAAQQGLAAAETEAEVATTEAERARLRRRPAADAWRQAADLWEARSNPYVEAYCRFRLAEAHLGAGDRAAAGAALRAAHGEATRLGARPLLAEIAALAARARIDLAGAGADTPPEPRAADEDPFGLTRRERDVLPLLVLGRTNRQIAEALFISENTAGVHVSNILGKLGAATRTEAAGIAARLGLGDAE
jgi:DNA-binding CsgD family transcriptional regulator/tetratricopeptide (TPR) repeat protein